MFRTRSGRCCALSAGVLAVCCATAAIAELPADQTVTYSVYNIPGQPGSGVKWDLEFAVHAVARDGDWVAWRVQRLTIANHRAPADRVWVRSLPSVETLDGLWHVRHADPLNPTADDPWVMPPVTGIGIAQTAGYGNLAFTMAGVGGTTSFSPLIDLILQIVGSLEIEEQRTDDRTGVTVLGGTS